MIIRVPVLVEDVRGRDDQRRSEYLLRPLFIAEPQVADRALGRGMARLANEIGRHLDPLAREGNHAFVAAYGFFPDVQLRSFDVRLDLRQGPVRLVVQVVMFPRWSSLVAFLPHLHDVWFQVEPGSDHGQRVTEVLTHTFREYERKLDAEEVAELLARFAKKRRLSVEPVEVSFDPDQQPVTPAAGARAGLVDEQLDGRDELRKTGRCLDDLHPDRLERAFGRDEAVAELERLLASGDGRPVALVGPRLVGKTAIIHEVIHRAAEAEAAGHRPRRHGSGQFWTLPPQRIIAGMSYLGQWEQRLLAILDFVAEQRHVLVLDDVLGLYRAGKSASSNLCVADVLRPWILDRRLRVVAELTPEQHRVLAERDRGLADALHVLRIEEPNPDETLEILLRTTASLEARHGARFAPDAVAAAIALARRSLRGAAFPGKAVRLLADLAVRNPAPRPGLAIDPWLAATGADRPRGYDAAADTVGPVIDRRAVIAEFAGRTGLVAAFVDDETRLPRDAIVAGLRRLLVGQDAAVAALADVVSVAKARLNDPTRPLGSLLLVGPTGVGKTQAAKALAAHLFGDPERIVRLDMNEFASPAAAARLVGTFDRPDGLLTAAVRRQPFAVLLFDEIEKAHPDVFDLLLQILGEARLTDAAGVTTDFANTVILLTSNLGSRDAARGLGFGGREAAAAAVYRRAVEEFFRPEFVNRIDHVVAFDPLSRPQMSEVAARLLQDVLGREGLARRSAMIDVSPDALEWVVARGYDPVLGARAMKRAVERHLVQPVARLLAATTPGLPTVITVRPDAGEALAVRVSALEQALPPPPGAVELADLPADDFTSRVAAMLDRVAEQCRRHRPSTPASPHDVPAEYRWHLGVTEAIADLRRDLSRDPGAVEDGGRTRAGSRPVRAALPVGTVLPPRPSRGLHKTHRHYVRELCAAIEIDEYFRGLFAEEPSAALTARDDLVRGTLARLDLMGPGAEGWRFERALLVVRSVTDAVPERAALLERIAAALALPTVGFDLAWHRGGPGDTGIAAPGPPWWDLVPDADARERQRRALRLDVAVIEGQRAHEYARHVQGTYLSGTRDGALLPFLVAAVPLAPEDAPGDALAGCLAAHERAMAAADGAPDADPLRWRPVVDIVAADGLRPLAWDDFLPLPAEFRE